MHPFEHLLWIVITGSTQNAASSICRYFKYTVSMDTSLIVLLIQTLDIILGSVKYEMRITIVQLISRYSNPFFNLLIGIEYGSTIDIHGYMKISNYSYSKSRNTFKKTVKSCSFFHFSSFLRVTIHIRFVPRFRLYPLKSDLSYTHMCSTIEIIGASKGTGFDLISVGESIEQFSYPLNMNVN